MYRRRLMSPLEDEQRIQTARAGIHRSPGNRAEHWSARPHHLLVLVEYRWDEHPTFRVAGSALCAAFAGIGCSRNCWRIAGGYADFKCLLSPPAAPVQAISKASGTAYASHHSTAHARRQILRPGYSRPPHRTIQPAVRRGEPSERDYARGAK